MNRTRIVGIGVLPLGNKGKNINRPKKQQHNCNQTPPKGHTRREARASHIQQSHGRNHRNKTQMTTLHSGKTAPEREGNKQYSPQHQCKRGRNPKLRIKFAGGIDPRSTSTDCSRNFRWNCRSSHFMIIFLPHHNNIALS